MFCLCGVAGLSEVLWAWVCGAGLSVSSSCLLSLLPNSEGPDCQTSAAAHSQQNLCHRWVFMVMWQHRYRPGRLLAPVHRRPRKSRERPITELSYPRCVFLTTSMLSKVLETYLNSDWVCFYYIHVLHTCTNICLCSSTQTNSSSFIHKMADKAQWEEHLLRVNVIIWSTLLLQVMGEMMLAWSRLQTVVLELKER